jgi:hypothetical protein
MLKTEIPSTLKQWEDFEREIDEINSKRLPKIVPQKNRELPELTYQLENKTKLGKISHFSTLPQKTCFQDCQYCYALKAQRIYPNVRANWTKNTNALYNGALLPLIPRNRQGKPLRKTMRLYLSGDFQNVHTAKQWIFKAQENQDVMFFGYTKQWQNRDLLPFLETLKALPNVVLRASVDKETGYNVPEGWTKAGILEDNIKEAKFFVCKSNAKTKLKCFDCKVCFSVKHKNTPVYFPKH